MVEKLIKYLQYLRECAMERERAGDKCHLPLHGPIAILTGHFPAFEYCAISLFLQFENIEEAGDI